jgi:hypothetical protein
MSTNIGSSNVANGQVRVLCQTCRGTEQGSVEELFKRVPSLTDGWDEFVYRLAGPHGCDFPDFSNLTADQQSKVKRREPVWKCGGDHSCARQILSDIGLSREAIRSALKYFSEHGCECDCEILLNIAWR